MKFLGSLTALALASTAYAFPACSAPGPGSFVVFGDSLSDNGNLWAFTNRSYPPSPPYFSGRFSNGPTWIELVAEKHGAALADLAWGGATSDSVLSPPAKIPGFSIPSVKEQVQAFLDNKPLTSVQKTIDAALDVVKGGISKAFFVVWGGGNDYLQEQATGRHVDPSAVAAALRASLDLLANRGGKRFIVPNLPGATFADHNIALNATVTSFRQANPKATVLYFDVNPVFSSVETNPAFKNTTAPCLENITKNGQVVGFRVCSEPDTYSEWDGVHPTAAVHRLVAQAAEELIAKGGK
ncbi:hypothetical protein HDU87_003517 [Geranomyces variabilis]|uniref:Uncharacterized protein n=1 Tax=Geranomyces variabilis TaxID=109894 RepID=A0AAD5XR76_9FUNG|nr:hypothetical protein HDU87_003517 [Geranomyces variabilis]